MEQRLLGQGLRVFFKTPAAFRAWLEKHHDSEKELWVGFFKVKAGKGGMVYQQALDEALCYGWIDGMVQRVDEESYAQRFTPRKPNSNWSQVNIRRAKELIAAGLMRPPGLAAFDRRATEGSPAYSFEQRAAAFSAEQEKRLKANRTAWEFFSSQPPYYRRLATWWVTGAKREETRERRLATLIEDSAAGRRLKVATPSSSTTPLEE
ncbi:MAG: bacteriocin-protection protein [Acidobacteria bacterium]|nr:MAG: bacteriocin-protection protein [Acidobacteriota bacterium]